MDEDKKSLLKRIFTGHIFSQATIEEIVVDYLTHPRQYNALFERLLFLLANSFLRAAQKHDRAWFLAALEESRKTAVTEEARLILQDLIDQVQQRPYIYSDFKRTVE